VDKVTLNQVNYIQSLTRRAFIGSLSHEEIGDKLGKNIWELSKSEASKLIQQLETTEGRNKFFKD
jgi:hypothetical protein